MHGDMIQPFIALILVCAPLSSGHADPLPEAVTQALRDAGLPAAALAASVQPAAANAPRWQHQGQRLMQPASTMKLVTSVVALDRLGPNHRGFTALRSAAPQQGDLLQGDLVLKGGADPDFGLPQLWALLAELRLQGIREIGGDLIIDRTLFMPARMDLDVSMFDDAPEFEYNVIPDALHLNASLMPLELASDDTRLLVRGMPPLPGISFDAAGVSVVDQPCQNWGAGWQTPDMAPRGNGFHITFRGSFPKQCKRRVGLQLIERNALVERLVRVVWQSLGGSWTGVVREGVASADARELARRNARPWGELLRHMNKTSDNAWARLLFLQLGLKATAAAPGAPATPTLEGARRDALAWFAEQGIDATGLVLDNGSGLSRSERISPAQMVALLKVAHAGKRAPELLMSLPVAGEDGGLRIRPGSALSASAARLKPGSLRNVAALAGYVTDAQGQLWVVAAMLNHDDARKGWPALHALMEWVAMGGAAAAGTTPPPR